MSKPPSLILFRRLSISAVLSAAPAAVFVALVVAFVAFAAADEDSFGVAGALSCATGVVELAARSEPVAPLVTPDALSALEAPCATSAALFAARVASDALFAALENFNTSPPQSVHSKPYCFAFFIKSLIVSLDMFFLFTCTTLSAPLNTLSDPDVFLLK